MYIKKFKTSTKQDCVLKIDNKTFRAKIAKVFNIQSYLGQILDFHL